MELRGSEMKSELTSSSSVALTLEIVALRGGLHGSLDLIVSGRLLQGDGQINDGHIGDGHAESHAGELAVQLGNHLADGLGGASRGRDDVLGSATTITPQLATGAVHSLLDTGRLDDHLSAGLAPGNVSGVALLEHLNGLAVDDQQATLLLHLTLELVVGAVIAEHVHHVVHIYR
ncbi:hypothetical protein TYRP_004495 [Tyrophagus putrescentiae]|nr:hypothetical protein TYRP_004495 [Tyrophagus putrescentiae]